MYVTIYSCVFILITVATAAPSLSHNYCSIYSNGDSDGDGDGLTDKYFWW